MRTSPSAASSELLIAHRHARTNRRFEEQLRVCLAKALGLLLWIGVTDAPTIEAQARLRPKTGAFWAAAGAALTAAALSDQRVRRFSIEHRSGIAQTFADAGNEMGTGRNLIAALAVTYVGARLAHRRSTANAVLKISAGYAVSNAIVGILKPVVGRHRPDSTNDAWRFSPVSARGAWHSFPSSHAVHAFSLATGVAFASKRRWAAALGYSAATVVAWSRVYDDQHWASDVTGSAIIGITTAATTNDWLRNWGQIRISSFDCIAGSSDCNGVEMSRKAFVR